MGLTLKRIAAKGTKKKKLKVGTKAEKKALRLFYHKDKKVYA